MPTPDEDRRADAILALGEYKDRRGRSGGSRITR